MPRGIRKTLSDRLYDLARTATIDEFVTGVAEMYVTSLKDNSSIKLHEIFGEMNVRAQLMLRDVQEFEAQQKAAAVRRKPKSLPPAPKKVAKKVTTRRRKAA